MFRIFAISGLLSLGALVAGPSTAGEEIEYFIPDNYKAAGFPFGEAVRVGNILYLSGQVGVDADMQLVEGGVEAEARQTMENIGATLARGGSDFRHVIRCQVFLNDIDDWPAFNEVYKTYFDADRLPARSAFATNGLALSALLEVECMAVVAGE